MDSLTGQVARVLETWPLQLELDTGEAETRPVSLVEGCTISSGESQLDAGTLRVGTRITVYGVPTAHRGITAFRIEILSQ